MTRSSLYTYCYVEEFITFFNTAHISRQQVCTFHFLDYFITRYRNQLCKIENHFTFILFNRDVESDIQRALQQQSGDGTKAT